MISIDIILLCYNQEQYISQALNSIFQQIVAEGIKVRVIISDDASTDKTLDVIRDMEQQSPYPMTFLPIESNLGISKNYRRSFSAVNADYVAVLEGDDYWSSPRHLQQHVTFLEEHKNCSMSMNAITYLNEHDGEFDKKNWGYSQCFRFVDVKEQIEKGNQLGNLSACVFRSSFLKQLPQKLYDIPIADWMLGVMMAQYGPIGVLKESTSVYRVKASGIWAGRSRWRQHLTMLHDAKIYDEFQQGKYHKEWLQFKRNCWRDVRRNWMHYAPAFMQKLCRKLTGDER